LFNFPIGITWFPHSCVHYRLVVEATIILFTTLQQPDQDGGIAYYYCVQHGCTITTTRQYTIKLTTPAKIMVTWWSDHTGSQ